MEIMGNGIKKPPYFSPESKYLESEVHRGGIFGRGGISGRGRAESMIFGRVGGVGRVVFWGGFFVWGEFFGRVWRATCFGGVLILGSFVILWLCEFGNV